MKIGTVAQVRLVDKLSIEKYGIDGLTLMENAAKAVLDEIKLYAPRSVCILCGKGNNAGDGFALAAMLEQIGIKVSVVLLCGKEFSKDAAYYFEKLSQKITVCESVPEAELYVDAVFGTGFEGALPEKVSSAFQYVNQKKAVRIAIDVPSGVACDSGRAAENAFRADKTVTFEILKCCHILPGCLPFCGQTAVKDIGLSPQAVNELGEWIETLEPVDLPPKDPRAHKGTNGTLFSVVGSKLYQGAAALSIKASLRCGCGIVMAAVPESIFIPVACKTSSAILLSVEETADGRIARTALQKIRQHMQKRLPNAILCGSGMGIGDETDIVLYTLAGMLPPLIVDGDALRYVSDELLQLRASDTVLTPHLGEFSRMCGKSIAEIETNRFALAKEYAIHHRVILVLKDAVTVITAPTGEQFVISKPCAGLAKGGSGDILAGMIASFVAQGIPPMEAAKAGVYYHNMAGHLASQKCGNYALQTDDILNCLPDILK